MAAAAVRRLLPELLAGSWWCWCAGTGVVLAVVVVVVTGWSCTTPRVASALPL
jgi:hypothetical protein